MCEIFKLLIHCKCRRRLVLLWFLYAHWLQLKKGQKEVAVLNPYPICYPSDVCDMRPDIITLSCCSLCGFSVPFKDIIVSSCDHLYHAWCASIWFKRNTRCKDNLCEGLVHPNWYKSFGFVEFDNHLEDKYVDMECELAQCMTKQPRRVTASAHLPTISLSDLYSIFINMFDELSATCPSNCNV